MPKKDNSLIAALDVGTTKICAVVGEASGGDLNIIGIGTHPSIGLRKGVVVNVMVRGELAGTPVELYAISGTATNFGPGGYEIQLADHAIASSHSLYIQLLDPNGLPISPQIYFDTHDSCDENITLINFRLKP